MITPKKQSAVMKSFWNSKYDRRKKCDASCLSNWLKNNKT